MQMKLQAEEKAAAQVNDQIKNDEFIMLPTVDYCFKEMMHNPEVRKGFIAALLRRRPEEIRETILLPTIMQQESVDGKIGILDVRVALMDGTQIDIEMQVVNFTCWDKRVLFYLSKMYTEQLKKGNSYDKLQKCIHVSILDFNHFPNDDICCRTIHFHDDVTGKLYTDLFELHMLELKKLPSEVKNREAIMKWMKFFSGKTREELSDMAKEDKYIGEAYDTLLKLSADEQKRLIYEAREKALKDFNTQMQSAQERGERMGEEKGICIFIQDNIEENVPKQRIINKLQKRYGLSASKAEEYYHRFSSETI